MAARSWSSYFLETLFKLVESYTAQSIHNISAATTPWQFPAVLTHLSSIHLVKIIISPGLTRKSSSSSATVRTIYVLGSEGNTTVHESGNSWVCARETRETSQEL